MSDDKSEAASEKKKRGRPARFGGGLMDLAKYVGHDVRSSHGQLDIVYRLRAMGVLQEAAFFSSNPSVRWLFDPDAMRRGEPRSSKPSILTELGRIDDEDDLKTVALSICLLKPNTKDAIEMVRAWRLDRDENLPTPFDRLKAQVDQLSVAELRDLRNWIDDNLRACEPSEEKPRKRKGK